jgi:ATP-binding cassette subfamily G (WHITE) protein 2 (PDR)
VVPSGFPEYTNLAANESICSAVGAVPGQDYLDGDRYINLSYGYYHSHLWRNFGILVALMLFGLAVYLSATEFITAQKSKGEVLLFRRGAVPYAKHKNDEEAHADMRVNTETITEKGVADLPPSIQKQTAIFHWSDVNYDIKIKGEPRKLLDNVDGWVKPGTLTALMGVSGAGKTTLLDVLASRVTMGVVTGEMLVNGHQRDSGFQRKTGYVQQQDLHLATSTVREALKFSAILRQPKTTPLAERVAYVDEVIKVLEMEAYADAVVGVPGEGLNVEQRKRLTIGVELAAKPALLLFLDEPTSGLDSQTAWSICALLRKLANNGQAILCTIHQPSAILFQEFDRLLFLARGGRTVYFGEIGKSSQTLTSYFERNGSRPCGTEENPAEWMLDVIGAAPGSVNTIDWPQAWRDSPERQEVKRTLADMKEKLSTEPADTDENALREFAAPFGVQLLAVTKRVFEQYWRTPSYLYSKVALCTLSVSILRGYSHMKFANFQKRVSLLVSRFITPHSPYRVLRINSSRSSCSSLFSAILVCIASSSSRWPLSDHSAVQQIMPHFVTQRALYEVRERPSKTYSWKVFMFSNIIVELPWNTLVAVIIFFTIYYPIGMYRNAIPTHAVTERGGLFFLYVWEFLMFTSTFTNMVIAGVDTAETGGNIANLMFSLCLIFCGVLATPSEFPRFWIFLYRLSPFTYLVDGMLSTALANTEITCSPTEYLKFSPPSGQTCMDYMTTYMNSFGGYLKDPSATSNCEYCTVQSTNVYLAAISSHYEHRWRNFGILFAFIAFNVCAALGLYWLARVPKGKKEKKE